MKTLQLKVSLLIGIVMSMRTSKSQKADARHFGSIIKVASDITDKLTNHWWALEDRQRICVLNSALQCEMVWLISGCIS